MATGSENRCWILTGTHEGQLYRFRLAPGGNTLGSHFGNQICLEVSGVSKRHAVVRVAADGRTTVEDLASKNGTLVNGERVQRARLEVGDRLTLATVSLNVEETSAGDGRLAVALEGLPGGSMEGAFQETPYADLSHHTPPSPARLLTLVERFVARLSQDSDGGVGGALDTVLADLGAVGICLAEGEEEEEVAILAASGELAPLPPSVLLAGSGEKGGVEIRSLPPADGDGVAGILARERRGTTVIALAIWGATEVWDRVGPAAAESFLGTLLRLAILLASPGHGEAPDSGDGELRFPAAWLPGKSAAMGALYGQIRCLARSHLPVLVRGETGVGKEGIARTLHLSSARSGGPFVAINCAAIPEELLEAELFGIGAGVATGVAARQGRLLEAQGGTLFLDEIGDMPVTLQAKLLRVLQEGEVQPLGQPPRSLDVRVVAATHGDLESALAEGRFRRDLFYRLAGITLRVPPLRRRREDIPRLVAHFMSLAARAAAKDVRGLTVEAMELLVGDRWPGNVRQLRHAVERWVHLCPHHQVIDARLVAADLSAGPEEEPSAAPGDLPEEEAFDAAALPSLNLARAEAQLLREALRRSDGNLTHAAAELGLTRQALRRRLARHDLAIRPDTRTDD